VRSDYTTLARRYYLRYRFILDIGTQVNFWVIAYLVFFIIIYFITKAVTSLYPEKVEIYIGENIIVAIIVGIIFGSILGTVDYFVDKKFRGKSLGFEILFKGVLYLAAWYLVSVIGYRIGTFIEAEFVDSPLIRYTELFAGNIFLAATIYTAVMIIVINFIKQMNTKFGPGILIPMLLGKFRRPRLEKRIFLFMDLKDSTTHAEKLGSLMFSELLQDCFGDVNKVIPPFNAEIYQYVGDEVVLSWRSDEGLRNNNCIKFFFAFQEQLLKRKDYYLNKYGFLPGFKAGANIGNITVAEVGDFKREIAYHGDTINTASRIQSVCNTYGKSLLISEDLKNEIMLTRNFTAEFVTTIKLKGKEKEINLFSVEEISASN
jgi:adenylate cyclase